jgi:uridine kinase
MTAAAVAQPFAVGHRPEDIELLAKHSFLGGVGPRDLGAFVDILEQMALPKGVAVFREGEAGDGMYFILEGSVIVRRGGRPIARLGPGDHFGEVAILGRHTRTTTTETETVVRLACLSRARFLVLGARSPRPALHFVERLAASVASTLTAVSDGAGLLVAQRSLPRRSSVHAVIAGERVEVGTGTLVGTLLPRVVDGAHVVAATLDRRAVSLDTAIVADCTIDPLTTASVEGRLVFRRSAMLLVLEAVRRELPNAAVSAGQRVGRDQLLRAPEPLSIPPIQAQLDALAASGLPLREELWMVEEARARLLEQGWDGGAALIASYRGETVPLVVCGGTYALSFGPVFPAIGAIAGVRLEPAPGGLLVRFGPALDGRSSPTAPPALPPGRDVDAMSKDREAWLGAMNVTSVGRFNDACVAGQIPELIRISEGFHEKNIVRVADAIAEKKARIVTIAGPSSSGKTTFIRRLKVQLEVDGIVPLHLSLDDYYVDREQTPRDEDGELDFEAVSALDLPLLRRQMSALLSGERVKLARFDFKSGKSLPDGGETQELAAGNVLLVEGLHGSNPALFDMAGQTPFRIFVHPASPQPLDRLSAVVPEDVRLLRRIVRDRHRRGYTAQATIARWASVRRGEERDVLPYAADADFVFDTSLVYEVAVLRIYAERYLLEVPSSAPEFVTAHRLRQLLDRFVPITAEHVPPTSILREFIGGGFDVA